MDTLLEKAQTEPMKGIDIIWAHYVNFLIAAKRTQFYGKRQYNEKSNSNMKLCINRRLGRGGGGGRDGGGRGGKRGARGG